MFQGPGKLFPGPECVQRSRRYSCRVSCLMFQHEAEEEDADPEMTIYCVTCGHQCNEKTAVKHMEKCYVKVCWESVLNQM